MRLNEIASILAPYEQMTPDALHGTLRGPAILVLMEAQPGRGRTSPADYLPEEIARARLLLSARDCGLTGADLSKFNAALNQSSAHGIGHPESAKTDGGYFYPSGLLSIIRGTKAGEDWLVSFRVTRTSEGQRRVAPLVFWANGRPAESKVGGVLDLISGETHIGTVTIPASDLIRPLLDHLEG